LLEEIVELLKQKGCMDIRYTVNFSQGCKKVTITFYTQNTPNKYPKKISEALEAAIKADRKKGLSYAAIARKYKISSSTAHAICRDLK